MESISENHAATWWQNLAADLSKMIICWEMEDTRNPSILSIK